MATICDVEKCHVAVVERALDVARKKKDAARYTSTIDRWKALNQVAFELSNIGKKLLELARKLRSASITAAQADAELQLLKQRFAKCRASR